MRTISFLHFFSRFQLITLLVAQLHSRFLSIGCLTVSETQNRIIVQSYVEINIHSTSSHCPSMIWLALSSALPCLASSFDYSSSSSSSLVLFSHNDCTQYDKVLSIGAVCLQQPPLCSVPPPTLTAYDVAVVDSHCCCSLCCCCHFYCCKHKASDQAHRRTQPILLPA